MKFEFMLMSCTLKVENRNKKKMEGENNETSLFDSHSDSHSLKTLNEQYNLKET